MLGVDAHVQVAGTDAMVFRVWHRNEKREDSKHQHYQPCTEQSFHRKPPIAIK